jgi:hypothetical protein
MVDRTKTYVTADWSSDYEVVEQLRKWNHGNKWGLTFTDDHIEKQSKDSRLNCSIKSSLAMKLDLSKTFVLIVGSKTKTARSGSCLYCYDNHNSTVQGCRSGYSVNFLSFIEYECEKAVRNRLKIVVLYKSVQVDKSKCPDAVKKIGNHVAMYFQDNGQYHWNYQAVENAIIN